MIFCRVELIRSQTAVGQAQIINIFRGDRTIGLG